MRILQIIAVTLVLTGCAAMHEITDAVRHGLSPAADVRD